MIISEAAIVSLIFSGTVANGMVDATWPMIEDCSRVNAPLSSKYFLDSSNISSP